MNEIRKVILENPPEGYEAQGEIRRVKQGEFYISPCDGEPCEWLFSSASGAHCVVLTKKRPKRWRARLGGSYWTLVYPSKPVERVETSHSYDWRRYEQGVYFRTKEQAEECAKRLGAAIDYYHYELGLEQQP